jgi:hypothetical protein
VSKASNVFPQNSISEQVPRLSLKKKRQYSVSDSGGGSDPWRKKKMKIRKPGGNRVPPISSPRIDE